MALEAGAIASHFALLGIDGREYMMPRDLEGKPALLVFFKTTCETCDLTFPYLSRLREAYAEGWHLWAIAQDPPDRAAEYARRFGISYPVLIDAPEYAVSKMYDPPATPTLFLVGPQGRVLFTTWGFSKADLNEIARLLAEQVGAPAVPIAGADDGRPDFRPG